MSKITFSAKNLFKDNPRNIERIAAGLRRIVAVIAGLSIIAQDPKIALWVIIGGAVLDEVKNFFHEVATDQEQVTVTYPAEVADQVTIEQGPVEE